MRYLQRFNIGMLVIFGQPDLPPCYPGAVAAADVAAFFKAVRQAWPQDIALPCFAWAALLAGLRPAQQILNLALASELRGWPLDRGRIGVPMAKIAGALTAAAGRLQIPLTDYRDGLLRVRVATACLVDKLDAAQDLGDLKEFNQEYSRRRRAAQAAGHKFMPYDEARARLSSLLAAAASGKPVGDVLRQVFDSGGEKGPARHDPRREANP